MEVWEAPDGRRMPIALVYCSAVTEINIFRGNDWQQLSLSAWGSVMVDSAYDIRGRSGKGGKAGWS